MDPSIYALAFDPSTHLSLPINSVSITNCMSIYHSCLPIPLSIPNPNHHICMHMCVRYAIGSRSLSVMCLAISVHLNTAAPSVSFFGSPKAYNCFLDEGLNSLLRSLAVYAHRAKFATRVFSMWDIQGALNLNVHIAAPHYTDTPLVTGVTV